MGFCWKKGNSLISQPSWEEETCMLNKRLGSSTFLHQSWHEIIIVGSTSVAVQILEHRRGSNGRRRMRWCREIEALGSTSCAWLMVLEQCKTYSRTANKVKRVGTTTIQQELPSSCNKKELFWEQDLFLSNFFFPCTKQDLSFVVFFNYMCWLSCNPKQTIVYISFSKGFTLA